MGRNEGPEFLEKLLQLILVISDVFVGVSGIPLARKLAVGVGSDILLCARHIIGELVAWLVVSFRLQRKFVKRRGISLLFPNFLLVTGESL